VSDARRFCGARGRVGGLALSCAVGRDRTAVGRLSRNATYQALRPEQIPICFLDRNQSRWRQDDQHFARYWKPMPFGICKLCLQAKDLQNSHLMPRALYVKARGSGSAGNQDPFVMTREGGKQSSYQTKEYVLCCECEDRMNRNGERYVMGLVTKRNGRFPLLEALSSVKPTLKGHIWEMYSAVHTPSVDRSQLAYFAISIFWRASVHTWVQEDGEQIRLDLGDRYNEEIRKYLMGESPVPTNAYLQLTVCSDFLNQRSFFFPQENEKLHNRAVGFVARGLTFFFRVSNTLTVPERRLSMVNDPNGWITVRDCQKNPVWRL